YGLHDLCIVEGVLSGGNNKLHVKSINYDDPIALELVQNARRCISLHGFNDSDGLNDSDANGIQVGGLDTELKSIVLDELTRAGIDARIAIASRLNGDDPTNICN